MVPGSHSLLHVGIVCVLMRSVSSFPNMSNGSSLKCLNSLFCHFRSLQFLFPALFSCTDEPGLCAWEDGTRSGIDLKSQSKKSHHLVFVVPILLTYPFCLSRITSIAPMAKKWTCSVPPSRCQANAHPEPSQPVVPLQASMAW